MKKLFIVLLALTAAMSWAQPSAVTTGSDGKSWTLSTRSFVYQIGVSEQGAVNMYYFGNKGQDLEKLRYPLGEEITVRGGYSTTTPMVEAVFKDRVRDIELTYTGSELLEQEGYTTLAIHQQDKFYPLAVTEYIRVLPEYDLLEKWIEIRNTGKKGSIDIENAQSGTFFLPKNAYELAHMGGRWGYENQMEVTKLTQGLKTLQVKDMRSHRTSFFAIRPEGDQSETCGEVWFGSMQYSGNWRIDFEKYAPGEVQVTGGVNFWDQLLVLQPGKSFTTPKFIIGYTNRGMEGVSQNLASFAREKVVYPSYRGRVRPVLYNSWYATTFDVNEEQQLALAKIAKELGVEVFVIDDGWFKGRVNDKGGLGDWTVDKNKFPNGLQPMIQKINDLGLDFGIWIEPEMVNPNSDLYRQHPDWVFHYPNRTRHETRNQLMLNLAREDVYQYLYSCFSTLLRENNIKFIKWDMNRFLTEPGYLAAPTDEQRAVRLKYIDNLYRLFKALRSEFPDVWFENCAGGGGRVDLGMMACTDFCWASDNTDPVERIFIQHSFLNAFPSNYMVSWVTQEDWHGLRYPLDFKFDVSMCGVLGVGYDITKWTDQEKETARKKIAQYKEIRETVHNGDHYRLVSPYANNRSVLQFVNKAKSEAVVFVYNLAEYPDNAILETRRPKQVKLRGLLPDASYTIEGVEGSYKGAELMEIGIDFPLRGAFKSGIFKIVKQ